MKNKREVILYLIRRHYLTLALAGVVIGAIAIEVLHQGKPYFQTAIVRMTLSDSEARDIQTENISSFFKMMFMSQPHIQKGDLTKLAIVSGALTGYMPDAPLDSIANERVRQSMARLRVDDTRTTIADQTGSSVKVLSDGREVKVLYEEKAK